MAAFKSNLFIIVLTLIQLLTAGANASSSVGASFVTLSLPSVTRSTPTPTEIAFSRSRAVTSTYRADSSAITVLSAKKKNAAPASVKKVQVKLLQHIAGTGQAGDVILVTPAFFNNKLRPTKLAAMISNEDVEKERDEAAEKEKETKAKANELQDKLEGTTLTILRKAGPDGQLFGGISPKVVMSELQKIVADDFLSKKWVKVTEILDDNGKKMRGDVKHTGKFVARISLTKECSVEVPIFIEADK